MASLRKTPLATPEATQHDILRATLEQIALELAPSYENAKLLVGYHQASYDSECDAQNYFYIRHKKSGFFSHILSYISRFIGFTPVTGDTTLLYVDIPNNQKPLQKIRVHPTDSIVQSIARSHLARYSQAQDVHTSFFHLGSWDQQRMFYTSGREE